MKGFGRSTLIGLGVVAFTGTFASTASAFDELIPGKLFITKSGGKLVKFIGKAPKAGPLFQLPTSNPNVVGATLRVFDSGGAGGDNTYPLNPGQWKELGNPPGSKGYKYKGAGTASDPCKGVLIKEKIVKAVCKDKGAGGITLTTPFSGNGLAILTVDSDRYCGEWGGTIKRNNDKLIKRKDAPAPSSCSGSPLCPVTSCEEAVNLSATLADCTAMLTACSSPECSSNVHCAAFEAFNVCMSGMICDCVSYCESDPVGTACTGCALITINSCLAEAEACN